MARFLELKKCEFFLTQELSLSFKHFHQTNIVPIGTDIADKKSESITSH